MPTRSMITGLKRAVRRDSKSHADPMDFVVGQRDLFAHLEKIGRSLRGCRQRDPGAGDRPCVTTSFRPEASPVSPPRLSPGPSWRTAMAEGSAMLLRPLQLDPGLRRGGNTAARVSRMILSLPVLIGLIGIALLFDLLNGLHDAANSIATVVSTRVLKPQSCGRSGRRSSTSSPLPVLRHSMSRTTDRHRHRRHAQVIDAAGDIRRADGRDHMEPRHLGDRRFPPRAAAMRWSAG